MATQQVTVISTDARQAVVKVHPGTYLADVLEQACARLKLGSAGRYQLKRAAKNVDLSRTVGGLGLPPGAKLELVVKSKSDSPVRIALQLPDGARLARVFHPDERLWMVLREFESGDVASARAGDNYTARGYARTAGGAPSGSGQLYYEMPVLNIMGREIATFEDYQKSMSQLGYNGGSVLIKLGFRKVDMTLEAAMTAVAQLFEKQDEPAAAAAAAAAAAVAAESSAKPAEERVSSAHKEDEAQKSAPGQPSLPQAGGSEEPKDTTDTTPTAPESTSTADAMDVDTQPQQPPSDPSAPVKIFAAPSSTMPQAASLPVDESDFAPSIAHAQQHQALLKAHSQNKRLLSDREIEQQTAAQAARLAGVRSVDIRVRLPDGQQAQWTFGPDDTAARLYEGVRSIMAQRDQPFRLVVSGTKTEIQDAAGEKHRLIKGYQFDKGVLVNFLWAEAVPETVRKQPFLKGEAASRAQQLPVPAVPEVEDKDDDTPMQTTAPQKTGEAGGANGGQKKMPKWLQKAFKK